MTFEAARNQMVEMQLRARGMLLDMAHPLAGRVPQVNSPVRMSGTPLEPDRPPPLLAQHTLQVLRERLAMDDATAARLVAEGVIKIRKQ